MLKSNGKLFFRVFALGVLLACLALVSHPNYMTIVHASPCTDCWDACSAEDMLCDEFCFGCPYEDERSFQSSTGHTINCAGGVEQCINNCHYAEMLCYDNCTYSSCGIPKDR
jgi:hypothetical protein